MIQALIYPGVIFSVCLLCILFVFNYIVPQMQSLFDGLPELPFYTAVLLGVSNWIVKLPMDTVGTYSGELGAGIYMARKNPSTAAAVDSFIAQVPGFSGMIIRVERIRFNTAITLMLESGILIDRCLEMAVGSVKNRQNCSRA